MLTELALDRFSQFIPRVHELLDTFFFEQLDNLGVGDPYLFQFIQNPVRLLVIAGDGVSCDLAVVGDR